MEVGIRISEAVLLYLSLKQSVSQLWVMEEKLASFLRILLDKPFHLCHQLVHLLGRKAGHSLRDVLRGVLWCHWCSMYRGLHGG